jgi:hypothetical protein
MHAGNLPERFEPRAQITFRGLKIHVSNKNALHGISPIAMPNCSSKRR